MPRSGKCGASWMRRAVDTVCTVTNRGGDVVLSRCREPLGICYQKEREFEPNCLRGTGEHAAVRLGRRRGSFGQGRFRYGTPLSIFRAQICRGSARGETPAHGATPRGGAKPGSYASAFVSAWSRSAIMSSGSSIPIETRTTFGRAPAASRCSSVSWRCVVEAE